MKKTKDDRIEDFDDVVQTDVAFRQEFKIAMPKSRDG